MSNTTLLIVGNHMPRLVYRFFLLNIVFVYTKCSDHNEMPHYHLGLDCYQKYPITRVGISGTTAKSCQRKFVPSSHPGPFALVASPRKSKTKVGTLACFDFL